MNKVINLKTNYNGKLDCKCFTHIDVAPAGGIPERTLDDTIIEIRTLDNSHPPVKTKLIDLIRVPLWKISNALSYPSHGMESTAFQEMMISNNEISFDKPMAVYFYERIN